MTLTLLTPFHRGHPLIPQSQGFPGCGALCRCSLSPLQGLVAIPVSVFYSQSHQKHVDHYIRFCFVKVKGRAVEGGLPNFPRPPGGCEERGRINVCWCRTNPRSRPWIRSCRSGRMNSGPDVAPRALCHLVGPYTLFRDLSFPGFSHFQDGGRWYWGPPLCDTDVRREEPSLVLGHLGAPPHGAYNPVLEVREARPRPLPAPSSVKF